MPTELLDVTLKYATDGFFKTEYFEILLKFFPLLTLMLTDLNDSFFTLSEYHTFLIAVKNLSLNKNLPPKLEKLKTDFCRI